MINFLLLLWEIDFCRGKQTLGCVLTQSLDIPIVSEFSKILILKSLDYSWSSFYTKFIILNIKPCFFFFKKKLYDPVLWMGFNCLILPTTERWKAESTLKPQIKLARKRRKLRNYYGQKCRCASHPIGLHEFLTVVNITEKNHYLKIFAWK